MNFQQVVERAGGPKSVEVFVELFERKIFSVRRVGDHTQIACDTDRAKTLSEDALQTIIGLSRQPFLVHADAYLMSNVFGRGPKVFRPTAEQLFALEKMTLNLEVADFHMPFPTIVVELPVEYARTKRIDDKHPYLSILHKEDGFMMHASTTERSSVKCWWAPSPDRMMEDWFSNEWRVDDTAELGGRPCEFDSEEQQGELSVRRAVANFCLLLDEVGTKKVGPATNMYAQLVKWAVKKTPHQTSNKRRLQAEPIVYRIEDKPIELVRSLRSEARMHRVGEPSREMPYHVRRGHYKMQPHGPGNSLRKRIRIPAIVVNAHLMLAPKTQEYKS